VLGVGLFPLKGQGVSFFQPGRKKAWTIRTFLGEFSGLRMCQIHKNRLNKLFEAVFRFIYFLTLGDFVNVFANFG
jgi:hypothetical protein